MGNVKFWFGLIAFGLCTAKTAFAQVEGFTGPGRYRIDSVASGKSLDVKAEDKRTVQQWAGSGAANQQWDIEDARDGYFYLRSVETNKVLDFAENRLRDGISLIVADSRDSDNQKWKITDAGNGQFTLVSKSGKAADVPANERTRDGARLQTQGLHGLENQRFRFFRLGDLPTAAARVRERNMPERGAPPAPDPHLKYSGPGRYLLQFVHSGKNLDLFNGDYEKVQQWAAHNGPNQQWNFEEAGNGLVYIRCVDTGKALEVMARRPTDGTPVKATELRNAEEQKWRILEVGNGEYSIVSRFGRALDVHGFSKDDGVALQVWKENRAENQRLRFTRVTPQQEIISRDRSRPGRERAPNAPTLTPPAPWEEDYVAGSVIWRGRVNREILLDLRGGQFTERTVTGNSFNNGRILKSAGRMPLRNLSVRIRNIKKVKGTVEVAEQPTAANNFTAVIRIRNFEKDSADYEFEVSW
jgi:hypothetical protein